MATPMQIDASSAAMPTQMPEPDTSLANFQRSWLGQLVSGTSEADYQDWYRSELSALNQYERDLAMQREANEFTQSQNREAMAFSEKMASTQYIRAFNQMKKLGINPVMMLNQLGGSSSPQGSAGVASGARSTGSNYHHQTNDSSSFVIGMLLQFAGKLVQTLGSLAI